MKIPLVIIDTNVFISGLIIAKGNPYKILRLWQRGSIQVAVNSVLISEIHTVLDRKKIKSKFHLSDATVRELIHLLQEWGIEVAVKPSKLIVRDPKDQYLLDLALSAKADFLISGDSDLLALADEEGLKKLQIISPKAFLEIGVWEEKLQ
jgi:putative PIN family toxin of toxin-antitoxin system